MLKQISSYNDPCVKSNKMYQIRKNKFVRFCFMFFSFEKKLLLHFSSDSTDFMSKIYPFILWQLKHVAGRKNTVFGWENLYVETKNVKSIPIE